MKVHYTSLQSKLIVIVVYATTNEANNSKKEFFYYGLNDPVNSEPVHDILAICGDFNTKIGNSHNYITEVIRQHGLGVIMVYN
jgi:hypothetical protein